MKEQNLYSEGANKLVCTPLGTIAKGQDGAIWDELLFRFDSKGNCRVYDLSDLTEVGAFTLDKTDLLMPHSNAVCFGTEFFAEGDPFPILYTNLYNTYAGEEDRREGVCCAYRIVREKGIFSSQLVQVIRLDFVHTDLWRSENGEDMRPYGNFVIDARTATLHAFVMRCGDRNTRFFRFALPTPDQGTLDKVWGVPVVVLTQKDILCQFDSDYIHYMQGAICHKGLIYSVEGFTAPNERGLPALRIFDTRQEKQVFFADLVAYGLTIEPEFVEVYQGMLYYADHSGNVYRLRFMGDAL